MRMASVHPFGYGAKRFYEQATVTRYLNTSLPDAPSSIGVLLVNTGTPNDPTPRGVRRFLAQMLSDPRLVELPRALWLPILHGVILRVRPRRSAHAYRKIWTSEGSPQLVFMRQLARKVAASLQRGSGRFAVEIGMCYGDPSIPAALAALRAAGAARILVLPLFPQYAGVTTASAFDRATAELRRWRCVPEVRSVHGYHTETGYLEALQQSVLEHWKKHSRTHLLMSFHGMPARCVEKGDPYKANCEETARRLAGALALQDGEWSLSFQSRFGRDQWLQPYTVDVLRRYAASGPKKLSVICPGFAADCLETLEEIEITGRAQFLAAGGESLSYIAALNDREQHARFLAQLITRHCTEWIDAGPRELEQARPASLRA
jgi:ferrochelatase